MIHERGLHLKSHLLIKGLRPQIVRVGHQEQLSEAETVLPIVFVDIGHQGLEQTARNAPTAHLGKDCNPIQLRPCFGRPWGSHVVNPTTFPSSTATT